VLHGEKGILRIITGLLMLAVLTGATGLLGGNLAIALLQQGHQVRATKRNSSNTQHLSAFDIEWLTAPLSDVEALTSAFQGADVVFHCAALVSIRKTPTQALISANIDGTRNVLKAIRAAGSPRLVFCSTVGAVGLSETGRPCTEENVWNFAEKGMNDGYVTTKYESELLVREAANEGLDAVIVNPSFMFGPYDSRPSSGQMIVSVLKREVPGWTTGRNNFVDVRDVAHGMILAWEKGRSGERYILAGQNMSYREVFQRIARIGGVKPPTWRVPEFAARLFGRVGDLHESFSSAEPKLNSVSIAYSFCDTFQFSSEKARRELGYKPGDVDKGISDAIDWFRKNGILPSA
jgi:dihydroflavonol-4-reductase